jgi:hypothetical protein
VKLGEKIERHERKAAKERERARKGKQPGAKSGKFPDLSPEEMGRALDKTAEAVGMSGKTYGHAKAVWDLTPPRRAGRRGSA